MVRFTIHYLLDINSLNLVVVIIFNYWFIDLVYQQIIEAFIVGFLFNLVLSFQEFFI